MLPLWAALPAAAVAGILMDMAYPDVGWWPAAFVATGVLLIAAIGRSVMGSLAVGLVFGLVFFSLLVSWTSRYLGPLPWAALTIVEGVLTAVWVIPLTFAYRWLPQLIRSDRARLILLPVVVASLWTGREVMLGAWPYGGFPWARLGMTQSEAPAASLASWVGVSGLSFAMVFAVAVFIEWVRTRAWRFPARYVAPLLTVGVLILTPAFPTTPAGTMRLGAVQGNGPSGYFDERAPGAIASAQSRASTALRGADLDLVVWPEGLDADPFQEDYLASNLTQISTQLGAPVLANAATSSGNKLFNTSFLWDPTISPAPTREQVQTHAKRNPVPFGEYVPDRGFYTMLAPDLVGLIQREYSPGTDSPVISVAGITVGLAICFDVIYDNVIAESITSGAEVLVFQTNNADFRGTDENLQQLAFARMRAIETGRAVVNVSTVGTSQVIRPDGSTQASLNAGEAGVLVEQVELRTGATPGIIVGTSVSIGAAWGGLAVLMIAGWITHRRTRLRHKMSPA
ncbi:apolipoprotein N-acyltransferase [Microbacterium sp. NPDC080220]|uniref:apolipoprotein N-acyltransferase n=1 Tax=Microbacterium sp. NPDC080220 TaxID=3161017 RepID=UPI00341D2B49